MAEDLADYGTYRPIDELVDQVDVMMLLRIQKERIQDRDNLRMEVQDYLTNYGLTKQRAERMQPHAIIMHPAPVNRGIESKLVECQRSRIFKQMTNGMYRAMQALQKIDLPLAAHVEDESLMQHGVMNAGARAQELGLPGIDELAETAQLARDLEIARKTGVHYHVCHVSTARSVELIRRAQRDGVRVTAEVAPHHLFLDEQMITKDNPMLKMNPPLRRLADRQALLAGLLDGTISMVATDHAPHTDADKAGSMKTAAFGITGLETAFALLYTKLVKPGICSVGQLINWMSTNPAQAFRLRKAGNLTVGAVADLTIVDVDHEYEIDAAAMASKGHNCPLIGQRVYGQPQLTMVAGQIKFERRGILK